MPKFLAERPDDKGRRFAEIFEAAGWDEARAICETRGWDLIGSNAVRFEAPDDEEATRICRELNAAERQGRH